MAVTVIEDFTKKDGTLKALPLSQQGGKATRAALVAVFSSIMLTLSDEFSPQTDMPPDLRHRVVVGNLSASWELWGETTQRLGPIPKITCQRLSSRRRVHHSCRCPSSYLYQSVQGVQLRQERPSPTENPPITSLAAKVQTFGDHMGGHVSTGIWFS